MPTHKPIRVLFVCLGNICRSPLAEGAFRTYVTERGLEHAFDIDSAGTGGWHAGEPPDPRSVRTAALHGVDISAQRSRVLVPADLESFDYLFAMDRSNRVNILKRHHNDFSGRVHMFLSLTDGPETEVPDPYYDCDEGFEHVWTLVSEAARAWLDQISDTYGLSALEI